MISGRSVESVDNQDGTPCDCDRAVFEAVVLSAVQVRQAFSSCGQKPCVLKGAFDCSCASLSLPGPVKLSVRATLSESLLGARVVAQELAYCLLFCELLLNITWERLSFSSCRFVT